MPLSSLSSLSERNRLRLLATRRLIAAFDEYNRQYRFRDRATRDASWLASPDAQHARGAGLSPQPSAISVYRRRLATHGNADRRGRPRVDYTGPQPPSAVHPDDLQIFRDFYLSTNQHSVRAAYKMAAASAADAGRTLPGYHWFVRYAAALPHAVKVRTRLGDRAFEAMCVPKLQRDYADLPAGDTWVGDERTLDIFVRRHDFERSGAVERLKLTAWADMRSRCIVGWTLAPRANSDTILAAFKMAAREYGLPRELIQDNGEDYKSVAGANQRRRKWDDFDAQRVGGVFEQCGITVHQATPYHPWAKPIESLFRKLKDGFDRFWGTFSGGCPDEKPADLKRRLADSANIPTAEQLAGAFAQYLRAYHAEPQNGHGTQGLSPRDLMQQCGAARRAASPALLDLLCCKLVGTPERPMRVTRDGVRWNGIQYGRFHRGLIEFQGKDVLLRIDPEQADSVIVCDLRGAPLCDRSGEPIVAENVKLVMAGGATQDEVREQVAMQQRARRAMKSLDEHRAVIHDADAVSRLFRARAKRAESAAPLVRDSVSNPPVTLVRPDLSAAASKIAARRRGPAAPLAATGTCDVGRGSASPPADAAGLLALLGGAGVSPADDAARDDGPSLLDLRLGEDES